MSIICDSIHPIYSSSKVQKTTIFYLLFLPYLPLNFISTVIFFSSVLIVRSMSTYILSFFCLCDSWFSLFHFRSISGSLFVSCLQKSLSIICMANKRETLGFGLVWCCAWFLLQCFFALLCPVRSATRCALGRSFHLCVQHTTRCINSLVGNVAKILGGRKWWGGATFPYNAIMLFDVFVLCLKILYYFSIFWAAIKSDNVHNVDEFWTNHNLEVLVARKSYARANVIRLMYKTIDIMKIILEKSS